jgi:hypothetical protein
VDRLNSTHCLDLHIVEREADLADFFGALPFKAEPTAPAEVIFRVGVGGGSAEEAGIAADHLEKVLSGEEGGQGLDEEAGGFVLDPHRLCLLVIVLLIVQVLPEPETYLCNINI